MGFLDAIFNPSRHTRRGYGQAISGLQAAADQTNPYYQSLLGGGTRANSMLARYLGLDGADAQREAYNEFVTSPAYEANLAAGTRAVGQSQAAAGMGQSGATLKALQQFGQDQYAGEMDRYLARLAGLSEGGLSGASGITGNATGIGQLQIGYGGARDAGNQAAFGNLLGLGGTLLGYGGGGNLSRLFQRRSQPANWNG